MGHYLCFIRYKWNISTLQNIKLQENESLKDFMKQFRQAVDPHFSRVPPLNQRDSLLFSEKLVLKKSESPLILF